MNRSNNLYIYNIGQVATPCGKSARKGTNAMRDLLLIEDASIIIREGKIAYVGKSNDLPKDLTIGCDKIDAQGNAILPGFVDSHTHLVFASYREDEFQWRLAGDSYMSIMERGGASLKP